MKNRLFSAMIAAVAGMMVTSCSVSYSFSGTSIQPDVKSITVNYFEYKAPKVNPKLSNQITEAMKDKYIRFTKLEQRDEDGDLDVYGEITGYNVTATAITEGEVAARNRLTVSVKVKFTNRKYPEDNFEKSFSAYADFDATQLLDAVQDSLCDEIVEKLVDDIFNATVAQW